MNVNIDSLSSSSSSSLSNPAPPASSDVKVAQQSSPPPQIALPQRLESTPLRSQDQKPPQLDPDEARSVLQKPRLPATMMTRDPDALLSGGGISFLKGRRNLGFSYGYSSFKGKRASMEDYFEAKISDIDGHMVAFFGVFDGHGGSRTAEYLKNNLFNNLCGHPEFFKDTKMAIVEAFQQTDAEYLKEDEAQLKDAGSTASTALLLDDRLIVANVGDSRVVACRAGSAVPLSIDHKPDRSDERQRIEKAGGFVIWAGATVRPSR